MKVYIASRLRRRFDCREYRTMLEEAGHRCTSRWLDDVGGDHAEVAARDLEDIRKADALILVGHAGRNAGCMTEFGIAYERGMTVIHVAQERGDNVFTYADGVIYVRSFAAAVEALGARRKLMEAA